MTMTGIFDELTDEELDELKRFCADAVMESRQAGTVMDTDEIWRVFMDVNDLYVQLKREKIYRACQHQETA